MSPQSVAWPLEGLLKPNLVGKLEVQLTARRRGLTLLLITDRVFWRDARIRRLTHRLFRRAARSRRLTRGVPLRRGLTLLLSGVRLLRKTAFPRALAFVMTARLSLINRRNPQVVGVSGPLPNLAGPAVSRFYAVGCLLLVLCNAQIAAGVNGGCPQDREAGCSD